LNPGLGCILKAHRKHTRKRVQAPSEPPWTPDEIEQFNRPQIPLELWRKGEALFGRKWKRLERKRVVGLAGRDITNNPETQKIIAGKANLRKTIANHQRLVRDFEFFANKLNWGPESLLQHLYWDCNIMHATPQTIIAYEKKRTWPLDQETLTDLCKDISALALRLDELGKTDFSPARTAILRTEDGFRLPLKCETYLLEAFRDLPEILRWYKQELCRKIDNAALFFSRHKKSWISMIEFARQDSLYEKIRARAGKYHAVRLHRLVNAARQVQGLPTIEWFAFRKWLNELKKNQGTTRVRSTDPTTPAEPK
jgi:hypothetical protein